jgi:restriction system protein
VLATSPALHRSEVATSVGDAFHLQEQERRQLLPSGNAPLLLSRVGWALSYMKHAGLVASPKRGIYHITDRGRRVLKDGKEIDSEYLKQFPEFREFLSRTRNPSGREAITDAEAHGKVSRSRSLRSS